MSPTNASAQRVTVGLAVATLALLGLVWFVLARLDSPARVPVERLEVALVSGATGVLSKEEVEKLLRELVEGSGEFELLAAPKGRSRGEDPNARSSNVRLSLELAVRRDSMELPSGQGTGSAAEADQTEAEALAELTVSRRGDGVTERYLATGRGQGKGATAFHDASRAGIAEALTFAAAQARALDMSNAALEKAARSQVAAERLAAISVLAERGHPAAAEFLLEQLQVPDAALVRRAVGGLVRLRDRRAVPAIIELSRGKSPVFQREMIYALAEIGGEEAEAYLFTVAEGHDDRGLQQAAQQALEDLGRRKEKVPR